MERRVGLPPACPPEVESEAYRLLTLTPSALRGMTPRDFGESAFVLEQFALYLQRATNREQVKMARAEERLRRLLPSLLQQRREYMLEEKKLLAIAGSAQARELERQRVEARLRLERLAYVAQRVASLARVLLSLQASGAKADG